MRIHFINQWRLLSGWNITLIDVSVGRAGLWVAVLGIGFRVEATQWTN